MATQPTLPLPADSIYTWTSNFKLGILPIHETAVRSDPIYPCSMFKSIRLTSLIPFHVIVNGDRIDLQSDMLIPV